MSKILLVGPAFPLRGGIADFNEALARQLISEGHDLTVLSFSLQYPSFLFPGKSQFKEGKAPENISIKTELNSINPLNWISNGIKYSNQNFDLVLIRFWIPFMGPSLGTFARFFKKKNIPVIGITDNVIPHEKRIADTVFIKWFLNSCQAFICMSESVKNDLLKFNPNKPVKVTPHPLYGIYGDGMDRDSAIKKLKLDPDPKYILFFGFIRKYKGLDLLLNAIADPEILKLNVKLIIAGEYYEDQEFYQKIITEKKLEDKIIQINRFISDKEIPVLFSAADLIGQPYRTATQSGVTQIAYYYEKPMLVTNVGGLSEIVINGRDGFVTEPEPTSIADGIKKFFTETDQQKMINNIREDKKRFEWDEFSRSIFSLLR